LIWKTPLPGKGCSTPVVWGERILLTCPVNGEDAVLGYDWEGEKLWQTTLGKERKGKHRNGSGSNPSVVTDGDLLFALFKSGNFGGLDFKGKVRWKTNLSGYGKDSLYWDFGTSPILTEKHVIVALMRQNNSWLIAFEKASGKVAWKVERNYETPREGDHSYATPILIEHEGKEAILVWGAERLTAHSAKDGSTLWISSGFNPKKKNNWVVVGSHVVAGDVVLVPYGRGTHIAGIRMGGKGDVTESNRLWTRSDSGSFVPTPAVADGKPLGGCLSKIQFELLRVSHDSREQALRPSRRRRHSSCRHFERLSIPRRERHERTRNRLASPSHEPPTCPWRKTLVLPREITKDYWKEKSPVPLS
jgi:outer membrane protein assembly factor BamB